MFVKTGKMIFPLMMIWPQVDPMHEIFPKMTKCDFFTHSSIGQVDVSDTDLRVLIHPWCNVPLRNSTPCAFSLWTSWTRRSSSFSGSGSSSSPPPAPLLSFTGNPKASSYLDQNREIAISIIRDFTSTFCRRVVLKNVKKMQAWYDFSPAQLEMNKSSWLAGCELFLLHIVRC